MANKKLAKLNKIVKHIFSGNGFDEGILRLNDDELIGLAQFCNLKNSSLDRDVLIKEFRREWSNSGYEIRHTIVSYLKSLDKIFESEKSIYEQKMERIDFLVSEYKDEFNLNIDEINIVTERLSHIKSKNITIENMSKIVDDLRYKREIKHLQNILNGTFYSDYFQFYESLLFNIYGETFSKVFEFNIEFDKESIYREDVLDFFNTQKLKLLESKKDEISNLIFNLESNENIYMPKDIIIDRLKRLDVKEPLDSISVDDFYIETILKDYRIKIGSDYVNILENRVFKIFNLNITIDYISSLKVPKNRLYKAIWSNEKLDFKAEILENSIDIENKLTLNIQKILDDREEEIKKYNISMETIYDRFLNYMLRKLNLSINLKFNQSDFDVLTSRLNKLIEKAKIRVQKEQLLAKTIRDFKNLFPVAREMNRELIFYVGETNSGKTYSALEELKNSENGFYLAPLRLLALENYEKLNKDGVKASLITGEEQIIDEDAVHISSTIEMLNFNLEVEVAVIDEVQMISDRDRGWAWANAIIGVSAKKIIMTGSYNALEVIKELAQWLEEPLKIVEFKRKTELVVEDKPISLESIKPHSAVVTFSRREVLELKSKLSKNFKTSVVYGNLSPEIRKAEAHKFANGESDILIATDAIAMGLNLPIERIVFAKADKFDGESRRNLTTSEILQISGRAGRYGMYNIGYVTALDSRTLKHIQQNFYKKMPQIMLPIKVMANLEHIKLISTILETDSIKTILSFFGKNMSFDGPFKATNLESMKELASVVDKYELDIYQKYHLCSAPVSTNSLYIMEKFVSYVISIEQSREIEYIQSKTLSEVNITMNDLLLAEDIVKDISLYLWLSYRFSDNFIDIENAKNSRDEVNRYIQKSLKKSHFAKSCRTCGKILSKDYPHNICQGCFNRRFF